MYLKKRAVRIVCAAMAAMMLLSGCGGGADASGSAEGGETAAASEGGSTGEVKTTVTKRKLSDQTTYDPYKTADQNEWEDMYGIYDQLFRE